ncbi:serine hydrolase domain-containing protein [Thalassorhabdomicrobium marinisediminis]|uniref:serine hydrolase domain-containing protein n=1 Tax=Thalassorhabdomicrobium marinisediminis TaxID=2170577 RepID=UPI0024925A8F|nr:serine hydrolase [Thalassorhabdomicrobium marinisediminis]
MRTMAKRIGLGLLIVGIGLAILGFWHKERISRLLAVNSLFAEDRIVANFTAMGTMFDSAEVSRDPAITHVPSRGAPMQMPDGFDVWAAARAVTGIVVLKDGAIRYESYPLTAPDEAAPETSLRISWSVAKSFLSVLLGILHEDGTIPDLDAPVVRYAPALEGSAYERASIRDVLQMSSGVTFNEDYLDFWSDINKMGRVLALGQSMDGFAAGQDESFTAPGEQWQYVSIDTHVLGMVIRGATGRSIPDLLSEKVIAPLGLSQTPYYVTDGHGVAFVLGGLNLTTRDYALFGQMVANGGTIAGTRIVSEGWIADSTAASAPTAPGEIGYGYQWWVPVGASEGQFMARGIYGQYIYIDRPRGVVIAVNGADRSFRDPGVAKANVAMFRQIAEALD